MGFMRDPNWSTPFMVYPLNDDSPSPLFVRTDSSEIKLGDYGRLYSAGGGAFKHKETPSIWRQSWACRFLLSRSSMRSTTRIVKC